MNLLINPVSMEAFGCTPPPLGLLHLAAMSDSVIYDGAVRGAPKEFIRKHAPALVGVGMLTSVRAEALDILRLAKECGARTVAGGPHVGTNWKQMTEAYPFIDHMVIGDGELAWRDICAGKELPRVIHNPVVKLDELPLPKWDAINIQDYPSSGTGVHRGNDLAHIPRVSMVVGRGCNGHCAFCSTWWVNGKYRAHGREWLHRHLDHLWRIGARHIIFEDDCLTADRDVAMGLCDLLSNYNFSWRGTTRADCIDDELAARMRDTGCYEMAFGVESGSKFILDRIKKGIVLDRVLEARAICRRQGIRFIALMMRGYPYETERSRREDDAFLERLDPDLWSSYPETFILPGTALYGACKRHGLVGDDFWLGDEPFFLLEGLRIIKDCTESDELPEVEAWGPASTVQGQGFNIQPDGQSAFWMAVKGDVPEYLRILFGGIALPSMVTENLITARFPHEKLTRLLTSSDEHEIALYDGLHNTRKTVGTFVISH